MSHDHCLGEKVKVFGLNHFAKPLLDMEFVWLEKYYKKVSCFQAEKYWKGCRLDMMKELNF